MQCLENIKHDIEVSPKCESNPIKANLSFFPKKALRFLYFFFFIENSTRLASNTCLKLQITLSIRQSEAKSG